MLFNFVFVFNFVLLHGFFMGGGGGGGYVWLMRESVLLTALTVTKQQHSMS